MLFNLEIWQSGSLSLAVEYLRHDRLYRPARYCNQPLPFRRGYVAQGHDLTALPYRSGFFPLDRFFAFVLCLIITLGQNYQAFLQDKIDWYGVAATYIGLPLFLLIWLGYRLVRGGRIVKYTEMEFPVYKD